MTKKILFFFVIHLIYACTFKGIEQSSDNLSIQKFETRYGDVSLNLPKDIEDGYIYKEALFAKDYYFMKKHASISVYVFSQESQNYFFNEKYPEFIGYTEKNDAKLYFTELDSIQQIYKITCFTKKHNNIGDVFIVYNHFTDNYCYEVMILGEFVDFNTYPLMREIIESIEITPK